jgi:anti-sigma B factor antagonist
LEAERPVAYLSFNPKSAIHNPHWWQLVDSRQVAAIIGPLMTPHFTVQAIDKATVVEFRTASLMDPLDLQNIADNLYELVDKQDKRQIVLDFEKVQYLSSQAIGIVLNMNKKLGALKNSKLVLCGVGPRLMELVKITRLDRVLTIKPTQKEAVATINGY